MRHDELLESLGAAPTPATPPAVPAVKYTQKGGVTSSVEERALKLLGAGIKQEQVASALGVTPGRIAQLLSDPVFAEEVTKLRCTALHSHTVRDGTYDSLEDKLLVKLEAALPMIARPADILKAIAVVNNAKRRGADSPDVAATNINVVSLTLPTNLVQKFAVNIDNQVIQAGNQNLLTMNSSDLLKRVNRPALPEESI